MARRKASSIKSEVKGTVTTAIAGKASATVGRGRKGRDKLTRVTSPIKVDDTNARQWNRYGP